jgi:hypothetical protein
MGEFSGGFWRKLTDLGSGKTMSMEDKQKGEG